MLTDETDASIMRRQISCDVFRIVRVLRLAFALLLLGAFVFGGELHTGDQAHTMWRDYGGAADSAQYSALRQINRSNVSRLQIAWTYSTGDLILLHVGVPGITFASHLSIEERFVLKLVAPESPVERVFFAQMIWHRTSKRASSGAF